VDLVFPHHQNEVAQSEAAYGKPLAKYWLHNEHLLVAGAKMAKSAGNFFTLRNVTRRGYDPLILRFVLLQAHYRSKLDFSWKAMAAAKNTLYGLRRFAAYSALKKSQGTNLKDYYQKFMAALGNDLNVPEALAVVFEATGSSANLGPAGRDLLRRVDGVLGLDLVTELTEAVKALLEAIDAARQNRDYKESDKLRAQLTKLGYAVENSPDGTYAVRL